MSNLSDEQRCKHTVNHVHCASKRVFRLYTPDGLIMRDVPALVSVIASHHTDSSLLDAVFRFFDVTKR